MKNPFKEVGNVVGGMWRDAGDTDFSTPGLGRTGVVLVAPIVAPFVFVAALVSKKD